MVGCVLVFYYKNHLATNIEINRHRNHFGTTIEIQPLYIYIKLSQRWGDVFSIVVATEQKKSTLKRIKIKNSKC